MHIVERGTGDPLVLIPGLQGRWEYLAPAVDALAKHCRVITFPLVNEPSAHASFDPAQGIDAFAAHVEAVLDHCQLRRAAVCGVSFGGLIALRVAARTPTRVSALVLASTPGPYFHLRPRHRLYSRVPWLFGPMFAAESPWRLRREIALAFPGRRERLGFVREQLLTFVRAPLSLARMAERARLIDAHDRLADCALVSCPTLIVHGNPTLDYVVDARATAEYAHLIRDARLVAMNHTGHLGSVTRPQDFAEIVHRFLVASRQDNRHSAA
jgi:pimeloyl-ACP methyl ester carboxylesterase